MSKRQANPSAPTSSIKTKLVATLVGALVGLLLAELVLRVLGVSYPNFFRADELTGLAHIPGAEGWYTQEGRAYIRINADGWRDADRTKEKPAGVLRIAVLGDSYTEALQVAAERTFCALLERALNQKTVFGEKRVEVLNFGVSGYGTSQEYITLHHRVWAYAPDVVLLAFTTGNDVADNSRALKGVAYVAYHVYRGDQLVLDDSFLRSSEYKRRKGWYATGAFAGMRISRTLQLLNHVRYEYRNRARERSRDDVADEEAHGEAGLDSRVYSEPKSMAWREAWRVTEGLLKQMHEECRTHHAWFSVITLSNAIQVHPKAEISRSFASALRVEDLFYPERRIRTFGDRVGFAVFNLAPQLETYAEAHGAYLHGFGAHMGSGHWNENGHRLAATLIGGFLRERLAGVGQPVAAGR